MFPTDAQQSENLEFGTYFGIASTIDGLIKIVRIGGLCPERMYGLKSSPHRWLIGTSAVAKLRIIRQY